MNALVLQLRPFLQTKRVRPVILLVGALLLGMALAIQCGAVPITGSDWLSIFGLGEQPGGAAGAYVLWNIRLPRALFSVLVGASLGLAGALTQGLFRNPLADPGLLGVSAGAACAAALTIVVISELSLPMPISWRVWLLPAAAFVGALGVCFTLDRIARWITPGSIAGLLLTGVALNALAVAVIGLCTYLATDEQLRSLSFWTLGSLAGGNWVLVVLLAALLVIAWLRVRQLVRAMNALALGESAAAHVGVDVRHLRSHVIVLVAVLAGFSVAWCGMIGFIGLIAPHLVRVWVGADQRRVVPLSMLMGGLLLLVADTLARTIAIPAEIPVGIFTALLGSPFFLLLLRGARGRIG
jgi:iron complex transport system permease protein